MKYRFNKFEIDQNILYVIQNFLGETTEEILASMFELANTTTTNLLAKSRARRLEKKIQFFYKKTKLPMELCVSSGYLRDVRAGTSVDPVWVSVKITFPEKLLRLDLKQLEEAAGEKLEKSIGLRDDMTKLAHVHTPDMNMPKALKGVL